MNKGYKGNRANATQIEDNYIRGQIKVLKEKYERWERVNKKLQDKGLEPKYTNEKFQELELQIKIREEKLHG